MQDPSAGMELVSIRDIRNRQGGEAETTLCSGPRSLAAEPSVIINDQSEAFKAGLLVLARLTEGEVFVSKAPNTDIPVEGNVVVTEFTGKHPAGLVGTHIHHLKPVSADKFV